MCAQCRRAAASHRGDGLVAIDSEIAAVGDAGTGSNVAGNAQRQGAGADGCGTGKGVRATQCQGASAGLGQAASAGNDTCNIQCIAAVKHQAGIVGHTTGTELASRACVANLQCPVADDGGASIGIRTAQRPCTGAVFGDTTAASAADDTAISCVGVIANGQPMAVQSSPTAANQ